MAITLGVDFGTRNIEICDKERGIVLREPNVAAVDTKGNVIAVGTEALLIRGRAPGTVTIRRPIVDNNITDFNLAAEILDHCLEIAAPRTKKHILAAAKQGFGSRNRELLTRALGDCHTGKITLVESAVAAYLGCGLVPDESERETNSGTIICDVGAGSVEASYIRAGELMRTECIHGGADSADTAIIAYIRRKYSLSVTPADAREARHLLSLANLAPEPIDFAGIDGATGMPRRITVPAEELLNNCTPHIDDVINIISSILKNLPRQRGEESIADRIILVGGGALTEGIDEHLSEIFGRDITVADDPLDATARGLISMLP